MIWLMCCIVALNAVTISESNAVKIGPISIENQENIDQREWSTNIYILSNFFPF